MAGSGWQFPDAWLMISAAGYGRRGCDLSHLIGTADAYNHDIPTEVAVERSVGCLVASGFMVASGLRVALTADGRKLAKRAKGGMFERVPRLLELLDGHSRQEGVWDLPPGAWQRAYDEYRARMAKSF